MDPNNKKNISGAQFTQQADDFSVQSASAGVTFATDEVMPDSATYVTVDDQLLVTGAAMFNGNFIEITARIMQANGIVIPLHFEMQCTGNRGLNTKAFQLVEGYLLSVGMVVSGLATGVNPCYAACALVRSPFTAQQSSYPLCAGYVSNTQAVGWPAWQPKAPIEGPGWPTTNTGLGIAAPAAGADWSFTTPASMRVLIKSISAAITTSAAVANRNVNLIIDDGANIYANIPSGFSQAASLTDRYTWMDGAPTPALFNGAAAIPIPGALILPAGHRIRTITTGIDVADQWSQPTLMGTVWLDL